MSVSYQRVSASSPTTKPSRSPYWPANTFNVLIAGQKVELMEIRFEAVEGANMLRMVAGLRRARSPLQTWSVSKDLRDVVITSHRPDQTICGVHHIRDAEPVKYSLAWDNTSSNKILCEHLTLKFKNYSPEEKE